MSSRIQRILSEAVEDSGGEMAGIAFAPEPPVRSFSAKQDAELRTALTEQEDAVSYVGMRGFTSINDSAGIGDTGFRLTRGAFDDLCRFLRVPPGFAHRLSQINSDMAVDVINELVSHQTMDESALTMVVDNRDNRVDGIVTEDYYSALSNKTLYDFSKSAFANRPVTLSNAWLSGTQLRMTVVSDRETEVRKGDVVQAGLDLSNAIDGDASVMISAYMLRLVCTNGMVSRDSARAVRIAHRGDDILDRVAASVIRISDRANDTIETARLAATRVLGGEGILAVRTFVQDARNGGGPQLVRAMLANAVNDAAADGRDEEQITTWDMANGITQAAHSVASIQRRVAMESLGQTVMERFAIAENNN